jgi:high-affinity nickel permease
MKKLILLIVFFIANYSVSMAQCAMCRATVGSNLSEGRGVIGTGINDGILLMLAFTYLSIPTLIYVWFRAAKKEKRLKMGQLA